MITIKLTNKTAYTLILILAVLSVSLVVYAYGTSNPAVFGHSAGEIEAPGTWCGFKIAANPAPQFTCNGYNPQVSCPSGYTSKMFANMGATYGGNWYTCAKD